MAMSQPILSPAAHGPPRLAALPPLALYVHVPWCVRKCPYCDFNSHELRGGSAGGRALDADLEARYVEALTADLEHALPQVWGRKVHTVFFGGGTPSLLSAQALDAILSVVRARLPLHPEAEITLEANPGTFEADRFAAYRALGVNRLSIGIQSFDARHLQALGRVHDREQALRAVEIAQASFDNFNLDLMYALPHQSVEDALADVAQAIEAGAAHVSAYHLTLEPNTYFHRFPPPLPDDETCAQMQEQIEAQLAQAGYVHYETSAFARPGQECRHNLNYWRFGDYLGIGAGAHAKVSVPDRIVREMRWKNPREYVERALRGEPVQQAHEVAADERAFEFMMNAMRLTQGVPLRLFEERTGLRTASILRPLARAETLGLIERDHAMVKPTLRGQRFLNDLLQLFLPDVQE
jgi:oxygen-independent coproporphyrinogen-3 oxidase